MGTIINTNGMSMSSIISQAESLAASDSNKKFDFKQDGLLSLDDANTALDELSQKGSLSTADQKLQSTLQSMVSHPDIFTDVGGSKGVNWGNADQLDASIEKLDPTYKPVGGSSGTSGSSSGSSSSSSTGSSSSTVGGPSSGSTGGGPGSNPGNVAGQGDVDPTKPITVPLDSDGKYDKKALDALAKQGLSGIDSSSIKDDSSKGGDPGAATTAGWVLANGPLKGIQNGAAIAWGCYDNGYTSNEDLLYSAGEASVESANSTNQGTFNGSNYTQKNSDIVAANTGGAEGLFQLDPHWHNTANAFNPFVNADRTMFIMKTMPGSDGSSIQHDAPHYNTGDASSTWATAQGLYPTIPGLVAANDDSLRASA
jgi:hypothetical protein